MHCVETAYQLWSTLIAPTTCSVEEAWQNFDVHYTLGIPLPEDIVKSVVVPFASLHNHYRAMLDSMSDENLRLRGGSRTVGEASMEAMAHTSALWFGYREDKAIYVPSKELLTALQRATLPLDAPISSALPPRRCCIFDTSLFPEAFPGISALYIYNDVGFSEYPADDAVSTTPFMVRELRIGALITSLPEYFLMANPFTGLALYNTESFEDSLGSALHRDALRHTHLQRAFIANETDVDPVERAKYREDLASTEKILRGEVLWDTASPHCSLILKLLLYMNGDADMVAAVHPPERPAHMKLSKWRYHQKSAKPGVYPLGLKPEVFRKWGLGSESEQSGSSIGAPKDAHVRKPHPHHYWVGPRGDRRLVKKELGYISIHGAPIPEEAPVVTITSVG